MLQPVSLQKAVMYIKTLFLLSISSDPFNQIKASLQIHLIISQICIGKCKEIFITLVPLVVSITAFSPHLVPRRFLVDGSYSVIFCLPLLSFLQVINLKFLWATMPLIFCGRTVNLHPSLLERPSVHFPVPLSFPP